MNQIRFKNEESVLHGFTVETQTEGEKPTLEQMQFLANLKMKRLGTPNPTNRRIARHAVDETNKILKIYDNLEALIVYFTKL